MGKKTKLHEAAERGESEELQRLLDSRAYDVNEGSDENYWEGVCDLKEENTSRHTNTQHFLSLTHYLYLFLFLSLSFPLSLSIFFSPCAQLEESAGHVSRILDTINANVDLAASDSAAQVIPS
jgi:hypothetical protein